MTLYMKRWRKTQHLQQKSAIRDQAHKKGLITNNLALRLKLSASKPPKLYRVPNILKV